MLFVEPFFLLVFLPVSLAIFWLARALGGRSAVLTALLLISALFYFKFSIFFGVLLTASIFVNFGVGAFLIHPDHIQNSWRKPMLWFGQSYNLATLIFFKYLHNFDFMLSTNMAQSMGIGDVAIPLGISFYTFHQAVFLMDAYAGEAIVKTYIGDVRRLGGKATGFVRYAAFVCFFPQLVIGPIVYMREFAPSTFRETFGRFSRIDLEVGLTLVTIGLFKKIVIADQLALNSVRILTAADGGVIADPVAAVSGVLAYFFQVYFDFSGYSDIALGLARMFGIKLPINFYSPLRASGIVDYYQRWHITLTRVIARFLFTPLALWGTRTAGTLPLKSHRRKVLASWIPIMANFLTIQLWHGAFLTFVLFGVIHGVWYMLETEVKGTKRWRNWQKRTPDARVRLYGQMITFPLLVLTFSLFGSHSLASWKNLMQSLLVARAPLGSAFVLHDWLYIIIAFGIVWLLPNSIEFTRRYRPGFLTWDKPSLTPQSLAFAWRPTATWALVNTAMIAAVIVQMWLANQRPPFLYQGF